MATPKRNEVYKLTVTNSGGCDAKDSIRIVLNCDNSSLFVPNTFSPNGDGMNDIFYPRGNGIHTIVALKIFNRWGEVIFDKRNFAPNDPQSGWNGLYKGKLADTGTYTYLIEVICTSSQFLKYFGNINLIQ
jgi:gliding motility-associated-like protein